MTDFELSMRRALESLYPGCPLIFANVLVAKNSALAKFIQKKEGAHQLYIKCLALPLLPCNEIVPAFKNLQAGTLTTYSKEFHPFMSYFVKQWIDKVIF